MSILHTYTANRAHIKLLRLAAEQHISLPTIPNRGPALCRSKNETCTVHYKILPALAVVVIKHSRQKNRGVEKTGMNEMDHSSTAIGLDEKIAVLEPVSPSSSSSSSSPVPAIKLKRKCSSGWTLTNNGTNSPVSKLRRGRVKLKLRSWMAEPLVVKEGDASLRLSTDLPRFNWLELKLNQKQDGPNGDTSVCSPSSNDSLPIVPLKIRILEKTSYPSRLRQGLSVAPLASKELDPSVVAQHIKIEEASVPISCTSRWPLKKRLIRQVSPVVSPVATPVASPLASPVINKVITPENPICDLTKITQDRLQTDIRHSPPTQRGPVIMRNVLPPTPPASSAPPELMAVDAEDQDKPLDLSKRVLEPPVRHEDKAEVEIIAMTTRVNNKPIRQPVGFQPLRQRFAQNPTEIHRVQRNEKEVIAKPIREYTIQRIPSIRTSESSFPDWSRNVPSGFRPYREQRPSAPVAQMPVNTIIPPSRPFVLPPLRPLPHHWKSLVAQHQRNIVIRPEVQLHPVVPAQPSAGFVTGPRLFHPQQVTASMTKKPLSTASHPLTTLPPDWSLRSCVVCSRRADFRCAGCHGNAYCSTLCQARDWPNHSQLCQRNS